jgi:NAD(P)-dependent dehydrogenase (short-subunit alcohol dehydrogenase family)
MNIQSNIMKKTILITGTSSGIGRATAIHFAKMGWQVAATMRNPQQEKDLQKISGIQLYALDVNDSTSVENTVQKVIVDFGKLDVLVNNAGYGADGVFEAMTDDVIKRQFETNVFGLMRMTRAVIPHMRNNRNGTIIQISSVGGRTTFPLYSIYHGTKWAVEGFTESLHYELRDFGIKLRLIEPGAIKTEFYGRSREEITANSANDYSAFVDKCNKLSMETGGKGVPPEKVARVIFKAAVSGSNRLRYSVAYPAWLVLPLRRLLPDSWNFMFVRMNYKI